MVSAFVHQPTKGLRSSYVGCVEFPPRRNCLWMMWGRDACRVYERKMADTERQTKVCTELWNVSPLLRPEDEEASSNRATEAFAFASPCSCFLFTPSSPRNLFFLSPDSSIPAHTFWTQHRSVQRPTPVWVYGFTGLCCVGVWIHDWNSLRCC